jgi:LPPG:FO 2-phospho-L-lactate transferase
MTSGHVLALCGGVGGAKLAAGLAAVLPPERLTIVVNTGDDFEHLGLSISPDIDTVLYTLSGLNDEQRGWGLADESWRALEMLRRLGEPDWFKLGDRDLATHIARTRRLRAGESLSAATASLAGALGIAPAVAPMSDDALRTQVETVDGRVLPFQHYFVAEQCKPAARAIRFAGAQAAQPSPSFLHALTRRDLDCVIICPSNPYLSIDPLLALPGVRERLSALRVPRVAVSPIVAGKALKGPLAKLMAELGERADVAAIARHYRGLIDCLVIDQADADEAAKVEAEGARAVIVPAIMRTPADRAELARAVLAAASG